MVPSRSRDAKNFHLPGWLPSLRAGGYGSKVHHLPRPRGYTNMCTAGSGNDAAPGVVQDGLASSSVAGMAGQETCMYNSESDPDDDDRPFACTSDMQGCQPAYARKSQLARGLF